MALRVWIEMMTRFVTIAMVLGWSITAWAQDPKPAQPPIQPPLPPVERPVERPAEGPAEGPAEEASVSDAEIKALEASLTQDVEEEAPSPSPTPMPRAAGNMNPNISLILNTALSGFSGPIAQLGAHDPNANGFTLQQLELHMESSVDPYFELQANIVFAEFGVEVEEAYARTLSMPWNLQVRAGQFLTKMGRLNPTHPHAWAMLDQPLVLGKFLGSEGSRGLGAEVSYLAPLPWFVESSLSATMIPGACCARSFGGGQTVEVEGPGDLLWTGRIAQFFELTSSWSLLWGTSAQFGPNPTGRGNRAEIYATDVYLRWRPAGSIRRSLSLQVELMHRRRQTPETVLADTGGYAQLVWGIDQNHEVGSRFEWVQGVEDDPLDPLWNEARQRVSVQYTWMPSHFSRLRLQGGRDVLPGEQGESWSVMLGLQVLIGAHGAHEY